MTGLENIVSVVYIRRNIIISNSYAFVLGSSDENPKESLKERIEEFEYFRDDFGKSQYLCKETQEGISMWKDEI